MLGRVWGQSLSMHIPWFPTPAPTGGPRSHVDPAHPPGPAGRGLAANAAAPGRLLAARVEL